MRLDDIQSITKSVTKKWTKQRKKEERQNRARSYRSEYVRMYRMPLTQAAKKAIPEAYMKASSNGTLPAHARQIFYAARPKMEEMTGKTLNSVYFTQTLLPQYLNRNADNCADWRVVYDARGHLVEPHTGETIPLGTIEVDNYLAKIDQHQVGDPAKKSLDSDYPTKGPQHRYNAILFIEKEGFHPLLQQVKLSERYDIAIMSTKGQSVTASRKLIDRLCHSDVPVLILHDFDAYGLMISKTLVEVSENAWLMDRVRYQFRNNVNFIDLGLRLDDVNEWGLESESVTCKDLPDDIPASEEERQFLLSGQRVELNAFTSADFVSWIETKLEEHGIQKVIPDDDTLTHAYRRAYQVAEINRRIANVASEAKEIADKAVIPDDLRESLQSEIASDPTEPWDKVLAKIAAENLDDSAC